MSERDPLLERLRAIDPAQAEGGDEARVRARVMLRGEAALDAPLAARWRSAPRLVAAGAGAIAAVVLAIVLFGQADGIAPGPGRALAIERGPNGVTLTINDTEATAEEMNRELEAAGIDRVRVFLVPGSPNHAGTWAGHLDLAVNCEGGPNRLGYGIRIPYHVIDAPPAPGRGFIRLELPEWTRGADHAITAGVTLQSGSGKRAVVSTRTDDGSTYAPAILIGIRSPLDGDGPDAKTFGVDELAGLGGDFDPYAQALADGDATCEELGLEPPRPGRSAAVANAERLLQQGPVSNRCVVEVLGTGLASIEGELTPRDSRRIHECSDKIAREARREHAELRARRDRQIEQIDGEADLPASVRARLDPNRATPRLPHGGVEPDKRGIDTGKVVLTDYDGHAHRTAPKRPGEYINLLCAARGGKDRQFYATTFLNGEPIANARVSCRAHGPWRSSHVVRLGDPGIYEIHLNGAGFDDFVIRARSSRSAGGHPNIVRPPDDG